jgi:hypothetical protein
VTLQVAGSRKDPRSQPRLQVLAPAWLLHLRRTSSDPSLSSSRLPRNDNPRTSRHHKDRLCSSNYPHQKPQEPNLHRMPSEELI